MKSMGERGVIQNVQVNKPDNFENRSEFYQDRKTQRLMLIEGEMMKNCSFKPTILS